MNQVGRSRTFDEVGTIIGLQQIRLDEVPRIPVRAGAPNDDDIDFLLEQLPQDVSSEESARSGEKYFHVSKSRRWRDGGQ